MEHPHLAALRDALSYGVGVPARIRLADFEAAKRTSAYARALRLMASADDADAFAAILGADHEAGV